MAVRPSMASLISRVRLLINDPAGAEQEYSDQDIQDLLDTSRLDKYNMPMVPKPTFNGATLEYKDYFAPLGDWEDDVIIKQALTITVTPDVSEPLVGHWHFATSIYPPVYLTSKTYDVYRAAADLLEQLSARWVLAYNISVDGQNLQRSQAALALQKLANTYRTRQRPTTISVTRSDLGGDSGPRLDLGPIPIDYGVS